MGDVLKLIRDLLENQEVLIVIFGAAIAVLLELRKGQVL